MKTVEFSRPDGKKLHIEIIKYLPGDRSQNRTQDRHRHDFHSLFYITDGESEQEIDFQNYFLRKNHLMLIPKGSIHWEKTHSPFSGYVILFRDEFFSNPQKPLLYGLLQYAVAMRKLLIPIDQEHAEMIHLYFELLIKEQDMDNNQNQIFILQNLMLALINKLEGLVQSVPEAQSFISYRTPFQRFIQLVESTFLQQNNLDYYASELNLTKRKLNDIVKRITGLTASNFIIDRVLLEAKRELCFSERSIKEVAFALGYESQYYFSRLFKKRVGISPEEFRDTYVK